LIKKSEQNIKELKSSIELQKEVFNKRIEDSAKSLTEKIGI
jgi:peptidoglycan hydrolase CwlO-like protein